jgi:hypothetical protein
MANYFCSYISIHPYHSMKRALFFWHSFIAIDPFSLNFSLVYEQHLIRNGFYFRGTLCYCGISIVTIGMLNTINSCSFGTGTIKRPVRFD